MRIQVAADLRPAPPAPLMRELRRRAMRASGRVGLRADQVEATTIRVVGDAEMRRLNERFMGEAKATDVLAFPADLDDPESEASIVLNWEHVCRRRLDPDGRFHESTVLVVHALAHLAGHDHGLRAEARAMHQVEKRALRAVGAPDVVRPYAPWGRGS